MTDPVTAEAKQRPRAREWWFWFSFIPWLGAVPVLVVALRRQLGRGAATAAVPVLGFVVLGAVAHAIENPDGNNDHPAIGLAALVLWMAQPCIAYMLPGGSRTVRVKANWPVPTAGARSVTPRYAVTAYLITFTIVLGLAVVLHFTHAGIGLALSVVIVDAILLAGLVPLIRRRGLTVADLGLRMTRGPASAGWAILALLLYGAFTAGYVELFLRHDSSQPILSQGVTNLPTGTFEVLFAAFAMAVAAPVTEEIFFRGLLFRALRNRFGLWPAALLAGAAFGLVHITGYPLDTLPIKACFGVLMCLLYNRTGSLLPGIAVHSFVDGTLADAILTGNDTVALIAAGSLLLVVLILWPIARLLGPRRAEDTLPAVADAGQV